MQTDGDRYAKQVLSRQSYVSAVLPYKRGDILDRNGTVLARSELQYRLILDPKNLQMNSEFIVQTLDALKANFGIDPETVREILTDRAESQYVILAKNLNFPEVSAFKELIMKKDSGIKSLWFEEEYVRSYPFDTLASDVIGFTSADNIGYFGIEEYYNEELNGSNGREYGYYDSSLNIERIVKKAENGYSIVSTIDVNVQRIIQKHIKEFNAETGSLNIGILIMDPNNGDIIAMASNQEYNLNSPRSLEGFYTEAEIAAMTQEQKKEALNLMWKNDVISMGYEPGSTFKPFTVSAALEEALVSEDTTFLCDGGEHIGGFDIGCSNTSGHGILTLSETLIKSCNDAMMQISRTEGRELFYRYQNSFGFNRKTGIDLPGEEIGYVHTLENLNDTELATSSFGQTFNTTMIQMAAGYSSLVNGGSYYQPHVVKQITNDDGATIKQIDELLVRQTVSKETSEFIQKSMYQTVEIGTAKPAQVEGYAVGGKTGTAEKYPRGEGTYLVSFLGAVPAINPEMVIYIIIDEPRNVIKQADSSIATKLASKVMKEILPALGIYPEGEIDYLLPSEEELNSGNSSPVLENSGDSAGTASEDTSTEGEEGNENSGEEGNETAGEEGNETAGEEGNETAGEEGNETAGEEGNETSGEEGNE
ncbi:MAG TPA: penicillin-binding protein 2, partial [Mobilitalea sp.]|nr:penicillin-binding protein 2 [Mobilitalea sp.]